MRGRLGARALRRLSFISLVLSLTTSTAADTLPAQGAPVRSGPGVEAPGAPPGSELTIYVLTMGVGAASWERFGHNAIVVEDRSRGTSLAYNYGMFSFRQENFLLRFLQGRMLYWMAGYPTENVIPAYQAAGRSVWRQELNLSPAERQAMRDFLQWNALPENRFYRYDYYLDNCSTRVRDALDRILGGAFKAQMQGPGSATYRFHTQRLNTHNVALYTGLMLALGPGTDLQVTKWDEMFLPLKLREYLREVRVRDSSGALVPLVKSEETLFESQAHPVLEAPPRWMAGYLLVGVLLGASFLWGYRAGAGRGGRVARAAGITWAILTGSAGLVLAGLWALTDHTVAGGNENVLQCSLLALPLGVLLVLMRPGRERIVGAAKLFALLVGALSLLGLLLQLLPMFNQVNGHILALTIPANLGLTFGVIGRPDVSS